MPEQLLRPIFVLGCPRSGTTLIGNYIATAPSVLDLGEYRGFVIAYDLTPKLFMRVPAPLWKELTSAFAATAHELAATSAAARSAHWYVDQTPANLVIADKLSKQLPDALFVLVIRHHVGIIQSLARSHQAGFRFAPATLSQRAELYNDLYRSVSFLPKNRTIALNYDRLCCDPVGTLATFKTQLAQARFPVERLSDSVFVISHASNGGERSVLGRRVGGTIELVPMRSADRAEWTQDDETIVQPIIADAQAALTSNFADELREPCW